MKDTLYLLTPGFADPAAGPGLFHCPYCARVEGVLSFHPELRERLEVVYLAFTKPRAPLNTLLGDALQACPVLVLAEGAEHRLAATAPTGRRYVKDAGSISEYLAERHGASIPHP